MATLETLPYYYSKVCVGAWVGRRKGMRETTHLTYPRVFIILWF